MAGISADFANFTHLYPAGYYRFMHLVVAVSNSPMSAIMGIRLLNALIATTILGLLFLLGRHSARQALVAASIGCLIPLGLFLLGSVNPSAWAIISTLAFWIACVEAIEQQQLWRRLALIVIAGVCIAMAINSRIDAAAYIVVSIVAIPLVSPVASRWLRRYWYIAAILGTAVIIGGLVVSRTANQQAIPIESDYRAAFQNAPLLWANLLEVQQFTTGSLGTWGLGQLDTPIPGLVSALAIAALGFLVVAGLAKISRHKAAALILVSAVFIAIPVVSLQVKGMHVGDTLQPRYLLPLLTVVVGMAVYSPQRNTGIRFSNAQRWAIVGALSIAQAVALHVELRRYVTGNDVTDWNLNHGLEWWWSALPSPMVTWVLVSAVFAYVLIEGMRIFERSTASR